MNIQELQNQSIDELVDLMNTYSYSSLFPVLAAKKSNGVGDENHTQYLTRASLRVPDRGLLKEYIFGQTKESNIFDEEHKLQLGQNDTTDEDVHTLNSDSQLIHLTHSEAKAAVDDLDRAKDQELQNATEVDEGEIVLNNPLTPLPTEHELLVAKELVINGNTKFLFVEAEYIEPSNRENLLAVDEESQIQEHKEDEVETPTTESSVVIPYSDSPYTSQLRDLEDFHFTEEKDQSFSNELTTHHQPKGQEATESLREISLPIEDDLIDEIGEELIVVDEEKQAEAESEQEPDFEVELTHIESQPVSTLTKQNSDDSMYKTIVNLLKEGEDNQDNARPHQPIVVDADMNRIADDSEDDIEDDITENELDKELNTLYAQAAYEAHLETEVAEVQRENEETFQPKRNQKVEQVQQHNELEQPEEHEQSKISTNQPELADSSQTKSFTGWLQQLSSIGANFADAQKAHQAKQQEPSEELDVTLKPEITTKQVQEQARKSLQSHKGFFTETLAYVYELQEKWAKAIEVYEQLSLQNPEKSSYFASQIELLNEKLK